MMGRFGSLLLLVLLTLSALWAQQPAPTVLRNVAYAKVGEKALLLDLHLPATEKPVPVVVYVHGGGWSSGSKDQNPAALLVRQGFALVSISYRFSQEAVFPAQIEDCKAAVRWVRAHAVEYKLDPDRIGVWGASAGGHLAALLGTSGDVKALEGTLGNAEYSSRVQAVCDWYGPADLADLVDQALKLPPQAAGHPIYLIERLLGLPLDKCREKAVAASPVTYISKDDPPFLIMHGDKDNVVPWQQSQVLHDALKRAEVDSTLQIVPNAGHGFGLAQGLMVVDFFVKHLKNAPVAAPASPAR